MHTYLFSAEVNYKSKTADHRYSTAYISNGSEIQGLAHWLRLQVLQVDSAMSRARPSYTKNATHKKTTVLYLFKMT